MGQEFGSQLKLAVAVSGVRIWKFHKKQGSMKICFIHKVKHLFCHSEVYKGIK